MYSSMIYNNLPTGGQTWFQLLSHQDSYSSIINHCCLPAKIKSLSVIKSTLRWCLSSHFLQTLCILPILSHCCNQIYTLASSASMKQVSKFLLNLAMPSVVLIRCYRLLAILTVYLLPFISKLISCRTVF